MSIYRTTAEGNTELEFTDHNTIIIRKGNTGYYVKLDAKQRRELGFELLQEFYEVEDDYDPNKLADVLMLTPKRRKPEIGQYYRVISSDSMTDRWQGNPVVRVVNTGRYSDSSFYVEQPDGTGSQWYMDESLEGPFTPEELLGFKA